MLPRNPTFKRGNLAAGGTLECGDSPDVGMGRVRLPSRDAAKASELETTFGAMPKIPHKRRVVAEHLRHRATLDYV